MSVITQGLDSPLLITQGYGSPEQHEIPIPGQAAGRLCLSPFSASERLIYVRPDGRRFNLHAPPSKVVLQEEGFGTPPLEYVVDNAPFQHGDTVRSFRLLPRPVQLVVLHNFRSRTDYWNGRAALLDAIRPNRVTNFNTTGKLLYYLANGAKRQLDVLLDSGPGFAPPEPGWREWSFTEALRFTAHDPAWYDPTQQSISFVGETTPTFPVIFPVQFRQFGTVAAVNYNGTWLEFPTFVINGPVTGLRIHNQTTDVRIALDYALPAGFSATITLRGSKTIVRNDGVNLLNFLTEDSDLTTFALSPDPVAPSGVNLINISGSDTAAGTSVTMRWHSRYFGI